MLYRLDSGSIKIIFSTYQIIQSITVTLDVEFPPLFSSLLSFMSFISFDVSSLACSNWGDVYSTVLIATAGPLVVALLMLFVGALRIVFSYSTAERRGHILAQHSWALLVLSYMVLPPVLKCKVYA
jgi:hypothetical protein